MNGVPSETTDSMLGFLVRRVIPAFAHLQITCDRNVTGKDTIKTFATLRKHKLSTSKIIGPHHNLSSKHFL